MAEPYSLTPQNLREAASARDPLQLRRRRMSLRLSITGKTICLPGVSTPQNEWTVPGSYLIQNLLGVLVFLVAEDGTVDSQGERFRISGVLMANESRLAPEWLTLAECNPQDNIVQVVFGEHILKCVSHNEENLTRESDDVDHVQTPVTPDPLELSDDSA